ncbi:mitochondrial ribosomal protein 10 [Xylariaceae sp. FL0662B]|nr:mitochondrial ribosomal protein 10 [Xylariaceae sp. FL0662B]
MSASQKPIRLPPLKTLRVRNPKGKSERPCMALMSSLLGRFHPFRLDIQAGDRLEMGSCNLYTETNMPLLLRTACWASAGYSTSGCTQVEQALRQCMDTPPPSAQRHNEINYHLARFKTRLTYQEKKKR